ncbi:MAG: PH domain-containing protein [Actinomycetota bacterium]|nr:PH domain-containing protein [Actinomycetota bacterium]
MSTTLSEAPVSPDIGWRRLSPRMLLVHPVIELGRAVPALAGVFLASGGSGQGFVWSLIGAALVTTFSLLRWVTTRFRITPEQIQLRRGLLRRTSVAAPLDRVRTVDVTAHLLHRVLGLAKVVVGTGTSDRKGRDRIALDGLSTEAAGLLRAELLHRGQSTAQGLDSTLTVPPVEEEIVRLNRSWVRYAPFTLSGAITGLALFGFAWRMVNEAHVNVTDVGPLRTITDQLRHTPLVVDIAVIVLIVLLFVAVASTVGYVLAFWNFRLTRHTGGTLQVTRGLITTRATSIERRRLHGAEVSESILLRWVGSARCVAIATGLKSGRGAEQGSGLLVPPAPRAVAVRVAVDVLGTSAPFTVALRPHGEVARRRRMMRAVVGALALIGVIALLCWLTDTSRYVWFVSLVSLVVAVPLGRDRYRSLGHALADHYVVASSGSLVRRRSVIDRDGVIGWNLTSTYFQRRFGLTTLTATTAAGKQKYRIYDLAEPDAIAFAEQAKPGLVAQFIQPG